MRGMLGSDQQITLTTYSSVSVIVIICVQPLTSYRRHSSITGHWSLYPKFVISYDCSGHFHAFYMMYKVQVFHKSFPISLALCTCFKWGCKGRVSRFVRLHFAVWLDLLGEFVFATIASSYRNPHSRRTGDRCVRGYERSIADDPSARTAVTRRYAGLRYSIDTDCRETPTRGPLCVSSPIPPTCTSLTVTHRCVISHALNTLLLN